MKIIDDGGQEYTVLGYTKEPNFDPSEATHMITHYWEPRIKPVPASGQFGEEVPTIGLRIIREEHVFGGVRFRETGEVVTENTRDVWVLEDGYPTWVWVRGYSKGSPILEVL